MVVRIVLYVIAALLLGAHYLRAENYLPLALCLAAPLLFFVRKRWSLIVLQVMAYAASTIWLLAAIRLVHVRQQSGQPSTAAALILGAVVLFTFVAGLLLNSRAIAQRYPV
jgi:hypothetical protein